MKWSCACVRAASVQRWNITISNKRYAKKIQESLISTSYSFFRLPEAREREQEYRVSLFVSEFRDEIKNVSSDEIIEM